MMISDAKISDAKISKAKMRTAKITNTIVMATVFALGAGTACIPQADADDLVLIKAETLYSGAGEVLRPGCVLVKNGKIVKVAESLKAEGQQVFEVETLIPGLVDATARAGLSRLDDERTNEITPDFASSSVIDWKDRAFVEQLAGGTTAMHLTPGTSNVIAGLSTVVKTGGAKSQRILSDRTGLAISMCSDPASGNRSRSRPDSIYVRQPTNRMGVVWMLRNSFQASRTGRFDSPTMKAAMQGNIPIFAVSRTQYDIQALMTLADEFSFQPILIGGQESWKVVDEVVERRMPVILQRVTPGSSQGSERTRVSANMAARLSQAGAKYCLAGGDLLDQMRYAVRFGLPAESALATITSHPASILKIDDRVGTIAAGKDADFVALSGDPLEFTTGVQWVMVDGAIQFEQASH